MSGRVEAARGLPPGTVDVRETFIHYGLDSLSTTRMLQELSAALGRPLAPTLAWEHPTIEALVRYLFEGEQAASASPERISRGDDEPIAIVGMACRFPGAPDVAAFWSLLCEGRHAVTEAPRERWAQSEGAPPATRLGAFLQAIDGFDPLFFGISPREARSIDPQQRLVLELCWEALEDAGLRPEVLRGTRTSVFAAAIWADYAILHDRLGVEHFDQYTVTGWHHSIIANRVSYLFGLNGPSFTLDAACSSGLVTVHLACESLRRGESTLALCPAVNLNVLRDSAIGVARFGALSEDGRCRTFDAGANGYVRGEGGGVVVLKRLTDAIRDANPVYAVIRGSAVNNDGASNGMTAPNPAAQRALLQEAYRAAGVDPRDVQYIEAHGTGTPLGDPIEAKALGAILGAGRDPSRPLLVGSAKTNIGHLEGAAGVVGLIKATLALQNRRIPPSLHFSTPNPLIPFDELGLEVPTSLRPFPTPERRLLAGVSSFGLGGTNAHAVIEEWPQPLDAQPAVEAEAAQVDASKGVVFVFPGQGSQWHGMARWLLQAEPVFRATLDRCDVFVKRFAGFSLIDELLTRREDSRLDCIDVSLPAIIAFDIGVAALWRSLGVEPAAVVGHSTGEIAAAHVAGALDLEDAMRIICAYGRLIARFSGQGAMALVELGWDAAARALEGVDGRVFTAIEDSAETTVLAGEPAALDAALKKLEAAGVVCRRVSMNVAPHCPLVDGVRDELGEALRGVRPRSSKIPLISEVTGAETRGESLDPAHWVRNFGDPARFSRAIDALIDEGHRVFVDVGPHPITKLSVTKNLRRVGAAGLVLPSVIRGEERKTLADTLAVLRPLVGGAKAAPAPQAHLLPLSAKSHAALRSLAEGYRARLATQTEDPSDLRSIAYTASVHRSHHPHRLAVVGASKGEIASALEAFGRGEPSASIAQGVVAASTPKVVFVFPGQGSQWLGMGRQLFAREPTFREAIAACDAAIQKEAGFSVCAELDAEEPSSRLAEIDVVQPVLFAIEVGLAALWRSWGVQPSAVVGHSMGEVAAAYVAGALSLEDAASVICRRSRLLRRVSGRGAMALVDLPKAEAERALAGYEDRLSVATSNGPRSTVIAGDPAALDEVLAALAAKEIFCRRVKVDVASHSPQMDSLLPDLARALAGLSPAKSAVPMCSTVTGEWISGGELSAQYWSNNLRKPVLFAQVTQRIAAEGFTVFLELSPHAILLPSIEENIRETGAEGAALGSLRRQADERASLLESLGKLYVLGHPLSFEHLHPEGGRLAKLPAYPWQRERHWLEAAAPYVSASRRIRAGNVEHPLLGSRFVSSKHADEHLWEQTQSVRSTPWLRDHVVQGEIVFPGAGFVEMALAAGTKLLGDSALVLSGISFERMLSLDEGGERVSQVVLTNEGEGAFALEIASQGEDGQTWTTHARGHVSLADAGGPAARAVEKPAALKGRLEEMAAADHYEKMRARELAYGPAFQGLTGLWAGGGTALGQVHLPATVDDAGYMLAPPLLDACFQIAMTLVSLEAPTATMAPVGLDRLVARPGLRRGAWVVAERCEPREGEAEVQAFDLRIVDDEGRVFCEVERLQLRQLPSLAGAKDPLDGCVHEVVWRRVEPLKEVKWPSGGAWLIVMDRGGAGAALRAQLTTQGQRCVCVYAGASYERLEPDHYRIDLRRPEDYRQVLDEAFGQEGRCVGAAHLLALDAAPLERAAGESLVEGTVSATFLAQALVRHGFRDTPRLFLVTRGAQAVHSGDPVSVLQAPLWGLGKTTALEHPTLRCARLDLDPSEPAGEAERVARELASRSHEDQIALRGADRHAARLVRGSFAREGDEARAIELRADRTYLITGGLGGLGLSLARWMVDKGARHLALVGRRSPGEEATRAIAAMREVGAEILVASVDVSRREEVDALLARLAESMPALAGVAHTAAVLDDHTLLELTEESFRNVFAPKALGALNLHAALGDRDLDFFLLYSSVAALVGSPGQGNYTAANALLDALAEERQRRGLRTTSIQWGGFADVGLAAAEANRGKRLAHRGIGSFTVDEGLLALERVLCASRVAVGVVRFDVRQWVEFHPSAAGLPFFAEITKHAGGRRARGTESARRLLEAAPANERPALLEKHVLEQVALVLHLDPARIDRSTALTSLGMDSLMTLELRNRLESSLGVRLSATVTFTYPNVAALARYLLPIVEPAPVAEPSPQEQAAAIQKNRPVAPAVIVQDAEPFEPIAVIGIGCRFPGGGDGPDAFFEALLGGVDGVARIPRERWPSEAIPRDRPELQWAGLIGAVDGFDAAFFGISPREAMCLDPQQRLLLEVTWEALEHGGQNVEALLGSKTGVFVGMYSADYAHIVREGTELDMYAAMGTVFSTAAGRISYAFGFEGPSVVVDTACSSSLVSVHLACQSLRQRESDLAVAGGVGLILDPTFMTLVGETQALAPDGRCKTFDARANGFVRAEGAGTVLLKRLSDAKRDGDRILAVIRGSAVNQDGRSTGLTAPNVLSQQALLRTALESARVSAEDIGYVETHGTGTSLGDPIEFEALRAVLGVPRRDGSLCMLGALKTNVGHMEAAAGIGGLIKAILCLGRGVVPKNLNFETLNPRMSLDGTPFVIPTENTPWQRRVEPRRAGVSAFGISGTNAHIVVEEAPAEPAREVPARSSYLLPLSAKSQPALRALATAYRDWLKDEARSGQISLSDIAYATSVRRTHHEHRAAVVGASKGEIVAALDAFAHGETPPGLVAGRAPAAAPKIVFVFSGQGSQWPGMGRRLLAEEPVFREAITACDAALSSHTGFSVLEEIGKDEANTRLAETIVAQPALFAIEVALAALLRSWGVEPDLLIGHSVGEIAAAHVAGALTLDKATRLVSLRARVMQKATGCGRMITAALGEAAALARVARLGDRVGIAAINDPEQVVLSGETEAIEALSAELVAEGIEVRQLRVDYAFHSPQMEPLRDELVAALGGWTSEPGTLRMISSVTGEEISGESLDATYWGANVRRAVRLSQAITRAARSGRALFVEIGPHAVLSMNIDRTLGPQNDGSRAIPTLRRNRDERACLLAALGSLYVQGAPTDWKKFHPEGGRVLPLPTYPWRRQRFWVETKDRRATSPRGASRGLAASRHALLGARLHSSKDIGDHFWERALGLGSLPYLRDHKVQSEVVFPGAGFIEMALEAGEERLAAEALVIEGVVFERMLTLSEDVETIVQVVVTDEAEGRSAFHISSRNAPDAAWTRHASGRIRAVSGERAERASVRPEALKQPRGEALATADHYERMRARQIEYGSAFQGVASLWFAPGEALGKVRLPEGVDPSGYLLHPALLDACFQVVAGLVAAASPDGSPYVPVEIGRVAVWARPSQDVWVLATERTDVPRVEGSLVFDLALVDDEGRRLVEIEGFCVKRLLATAEDPLARVVHEVAWRRVEPLPAMHWAEPSAWLVFMDRSGVGESLCALLAAQGQRCVRVFEGASYARLEEDRHTLDYSKLDEYRRLLRDAFGEGGTCRGVLHLASLDAAPFEATTVETLAVDLERGSVSATYLAQALLGHGFQALPRLFLLTRGAQAVAPGESVSVSQAPLLGLARTIAVEHPELRCARLDLAADAFDEEIELIARHLVHEDGEDQIALRRDGRYVARLVQGSFGLEQGARPEPRLEPADARPFHLAIRRVGVLGELTLEEMRPLEPGPLDVVIEVEVAGLNFRDVLLALGVVPDDADGAEPGRPRLGYECAGRVVAVGEAVTEFAVGDEVLAIATRSFGTYAKTSSGLCARKPPWLRWEEAATMPIAFMTAYYALHDLGRLAPGERVLIHAGAGGVGLAAIQYAKYIGAEIFATAGSEAKREYLRSLGVVHVLDSRSLGFAEKIRSITKGEGVDVVLNSLSGEFIPASISLLRDHGRFIEIGLRDAYDDKQLGLRPFLRNLSLSLLDLRGVLRKWPERARVILRDIVGLVEKKVFAPLPTIVFPASRAADAFHDLAQAKHIGRLAIAMKDSSVRIEPLHTAEAVALRPDRSYLITGGLTGLGLSLASWLVERGARHVALVGRRTPNAEAERAIAAMREAGADVFVASVDVSRREELAALFSTLDVAMPKLAGVVHAAAVLDDHTLLDLSGDSFRAVFAPKALGAWNLHELTRERGLDFFLLYSSVASLLGSPGQGNYTAANAMLDALARERSRRGLRSISVQWGPFGGVGLAAQGDNRGKRLESRGIGIFSATEGLSALQRLFERPRAEVGVVRLDARRWSEFYSSAGRSGFFAELLAEGARVAAAEDARSSELLAALAGAEDAARFAMMEDFLAREMGYLLRLDVSQIERGASFHRLGVDSLMRLELRNRIRMGLGFEPSIVALSKYDELGALAAHLLQELSIKHLVKDVQAAPEKSDEEMEILTI
ncbi:type I polyketide synthase [Polyangium spumosum]|uniref:type I polyketide synthase n=1 Tax=Polyangium spumosum TaxID=889282 RepID=UPI0014790433|nr:type I polyketide synthase [Polyangium spumosum]